MRTRQLAVLGILLAAFIAWFVLDLGSYLQLETLQQRIGELRNWYDHNPLLAGLIYFSCYVIVAALSIPGAAIMTLAGGALFGFWYALLLVSFASTIGATLAFLASRLLLRDWVQGRFGKYLDAVNRGFAREGVCYHFSMRLVAR